MTRSPTISLPRWRGEEPLADKAERALATLLSKTPGLGEMIDQVPLDRTLAELSTYETALGYPQLKPRLQDLHIVLRSRFGELLPMKYGLAVLAALIQSHEERWNKRPLDDALKPEFIDSFHRLLDAVSRGGVHALQPDTDAFAKELAICLHRLVPAGGQLIDPGSAIPRRTLLGGPPRQLIQGLRYVFFKSKGRAPFAELHTNAFMRHYFTPDGWEYCFRLLPAVFRSYPRPEGLDRLELVFRSSLEHNQPGIALRAWHC